MINDGDITDRQLERIEDVRNALECSGVSKQSDPVVELDEGYVMVTTYTTLLIPAEDPHHMDTVDVKVVHQFDENGELCQYNVSSSNKSVHH